jgi:hypothetical protein
LADLKPRGRSVTEQESDHSKLAGGARLPLAITDLFRGCKRSLPIVLGCHGIDLQIDVATDNETAKA